MQFVIALFLMISFVGTSQAADPIKVRWSVAHDPKSPDAAKLMQDFADRVAKKSAGRLAIELVPMPGGDGVFHEKALRQVESGEMEMSQVSVTNLAHLNQNMNALFMPYLFENHAQALSVMDSKVGKDLLAGVGKASSVHALEFTYSGGFRQLYGTKAVHTLADLKGYRMLEPTSEVSRLFFKAVGVSFVGESSHERKKAIEAFEAKMIDGEEGEFARVGEWTRRKLVPYVSELNHELFITSIVINKDFEKKLPKDLHKLLVSEVRELAVAERKFSIELEGTVREALKKDGVHVETISAADRAQFAAASKPVYDHYKGTAIQRITDLIRKMNALEKVTAN